HQAVPPARRRWPVPETWRVPLPTRPQTPSRETQRAALLLSALWDEATSRAVADPGLRAAPPLPRPTAPHAACVPATVTPPPGSPARRECRPGSRRAGTAAAPPPRATA